MSSLLVWAVVAAALALLAVVVGVRAQKLVLGILVDDRNRFSLTRFQVVGWTLLLFSMFAAVAAKRASNDTTTSLDFVIPGELLLVLGISLSSTVIATAIKAVKDSRDAGTIKRGLAPAARTSDSDPELKPFFFQVFLQEDGAMADKVVDVAKFQNFCLTVALWVGYVAVGGAFLRQGELKSLPGFTDQFVTLLAISHGTYLAGKLPDHSGQPALTANREGNAPQTTQVTPATGGQVTSTSGQ